MKNCFAFKLVEKVTGKKKKKPKINHYQKKKSFELSHFMQTQKIYSVLKRWINVNIVCNLLSYCLML